jgi:hypothetical protein
MVKEPKKGTAGYIEEVAVEGTLFYVVPESFLKKRRTRRRRKKVECGTKQRLLFHRL